MRGLRRVNAEVVVKDEIPGPCHMIRMYSRN